MGCGDNRISPVAMNVTNSRKEFGPERGSKQRPPLLRSDTLLSELRDAKIRKWKGLILIEVQSCFPGCVPG